VCENASGRLWGRGTAIAWIAHGLKAARHGGQFRCLADVTAGGEQPIQGWPESNPV